MSDRTEFLITAGAILIIIGVFTLAIATALGFGMPRGESTYTGVVADVEVDSGFPFATTEAHFRLSPQASSTETFCVHPSNEAEQIPKLQRAQRTGAEVTVIYSRPLFVGRWDCGREDNSSLSIIRNVTVHNTTP